MTRLDSPLGGLGNGLDSSDSERRRAQETVCHYATGPEDAALLLDILGLRDQPKPRNAGLCRVCGRALSISAMTAKGGGGRCGGCRKRARQDGAE